MTYDARAAHAPYKILYNSVSRDWQLSFAKCLCHANLLRLLQWSRVVLTSVAPSSYPLVLTRIRSALPWEGGGASEV